jgi:DNA-binding response OmpR family regulator
MNNKISEEKQSFRVVLIEDDDTICDLISDFLDDEEYEFDVFNSIEEAKSKVKTTDILIVDVMINRKRSAGVDFVLDLKKNLPEFSRKKVIFISNYERKPVDPKLQELEGQYSWLNKPFDMLELDLAIEEVKTNGQ